MSQKHPTVFISYSWDNEEHKEWVLKLADTLISNHGVDVLLDRYELHAGKPLTGFMERSIINSDKVIIILTPGYKKKAGMGEGGAGFEHSIISSELFILQQNNKKFIPVLRSGTEETSAPGYLKTLINLPMLDDDIFESKVDELARIIHDKPLIVRPEVGSVPDYDNIDSIDPTLLKLSKLREEQIIQRKRDGFLHTNSSEESVLLMDQYSSDLFLKIEEKKKEYDNNGLNYFIINKGERANSSSLVLSAYQSLYALVFIYEKIYQNTTHGSGLYIELITGPVYSQNNSLSSRPSTKKLFARTYTFDVDGELNPMWKFKENFFTNEEIVKDYFFLLTEKIIDEWNRKSK